MLTALSAAGAFLVFLLWVNSSQFVLKTYIYTSVLALLVSGLGMMLYMVGKGYAEYKMQYQEADFSIFLDDVVPQSYGKNYWIFRWFMKYGRIPAGILLLAVFSMYGLLFATAFQIRNRLGRLAALGGSLALSVQGLLYVLGNFGHRFGMFGNLPFVSEGFVSITGSAVLAGLVLSAYRFDTVVTEKK